MTLWKNKYFPTQIAICHFNFVMNFLHIVVKTVKIFHSYFLRCSSYTLKCSQLCVQYNEILKFRNLCNPQIQNISISTERGHVQIFITIDSCFRTSYKCNHTIYPLESIFVFFCFLLHPMFLRLLNVIACIIYLTWAFATCALCE